MRAIRIAVAVVALVAFPMLGRGSILVLEPWTDGFPPNPCLPVSQQPVLFTHLFCDGEACPPGSIVGPCWPGAMATQADLPGIGPGITRVTSVSAQPGFGLPPFSFSVRVVPERQRLEFTCPEPRPGGNISITYDGGIGWDLNPVTMGATEIRVSVDGDISPTHPLSCYVLLEDVGDGTEDSIEQYANAVVSVTAPGEFVLPLASFARDPSTFDLDGLDWIVFSFFAANCSPAGCVGGDVPPQFSVGPFRFEASGPVGARRSTWGRVKALYR